MSITARTITAVGITARSITAKTIQVYRDIIQYCRYVSNFNGTTSYAESLTRIIDLDAPDPSFKFTWWGDLDGSGTHFAQNISNSTASKEFEAYTDGSLDIVLGGIVRSILNSPAVTANAGYGLLEVEYHHSLAEIYIRKNGVLLSTTTSIVIGAAREPTAKFKYMARSNGSINSEGFFKAGQLKNAIIEHNGVTVDLPMTEHNKDLDDEILYINDASDDFYVMLNGTSASQINTNGVDLTTVFAVKMTCELSTDATLFGYDSSTLFARLTGTDRIQVYDGGALGTSGFYSGNLKVGFHEYYIFVNGSNRIEIVVDGQNLGALNTRNFTGVMDFLIGANSGTTRHINGGVKSFEMWTDGTDITGNKIIDYQCNEYKSNFVSNLANPLGTSVWDDNSAVLTGDTTELNGQYSMTTATSSVYLDVPSSTGLGYLLTIDLVSGDIQELEGGLSGVQNTGWQNARDAQQQPIPNRYVTLVNNTTNDNLTITKTGSNPVVFNSVSYQRAIDYGVLNGTRGTDYDWTSDSHHAIGYDITTEQVCVTIPANTVFVDGVPVTDEAGEYVTA